jgi:hypothetical protein
VSRSNAAAASAQASPGGALTADQIASAYRFPSLYAAGVTVAVYELEAYQGSDISAYQSCYGTNASVTGVAVDGGAGRGSGSGEAALDIEDVLGLAPKAAVQGQSIFAAAGDNGSDDCQDNGTPSGDDPVSKPYVTGVGGTTLSSAVPPTVETVWNHGGATGGGLSSLWVLPLYESSAATLADGSATCAGADIGFANPSLYRIAESGYSGNFDDITSGNNGWDSVSGFSAAPGYDMASGLRTPIVASLAPALCGDLVTVAQPPSQNSDTTTNESLQLSATSSAGTAVGYGAADLPPGRALDPATGEISGTPTAAGSWTVTVSATDASGSVGDADFNWVVTGLTSPMSATSPAPTSTAPTANAPVSTVTVTQPAAQSGSVGGSQRLQIEATDGGGLALTYRAVGLPAGLSINPRTGLISGKLSRPVKVTVAVRVSEGRRSSSTTGFRWTAAARPRVTASSLQLLRSGRTQLSVSLSAGTDAAPPVSISRDLTARIADQRSKPVRLIVMVTDAMNLRTRLRVAVNLPA